MDSLEFWFNSSRNLKKGQKPIKHTKFGDMMKKWNEVRLFGLMSALLLGLFAAQTIYAAGISSSPLPQSLGQGFNQDGLKRIDAYF